MRRNIKDCFETLPSEPQGTNVELESAGADCTHRLASGLCVSRFRGVCVCVWTDVYEI